MNKIKITIMLIDEDLEIVKSFEDEINYEEYLIIKGAREFSTSKFNKEGKVENLFVILDTYNLDLKIVAITVTKDKFKIEKFKKSKS